MSNIRSSHGNRGPSRRSITLALAVAVCLCAHAAAQTVYQGTLTSGQKAEVSLWSTLYWQRFDQGGGNPGAAFSFSVATMNSQLFNPLRAARATLETVQSLTPGACDGLGASITAPDLIDTEVATAFRNIMTNGEIITNAAVNPVGTYEHAVLILSADPDLGITVTLNGLALISFGLPLEQVSAPSTNPVLNYNLGTESVQLITSLFNAGPQWATESGNVTEHTKLITGQPSKADNFAGKVRTFLSGLGREGERVDIFYATFGVYGELPIIFVPLPDAYVLMDPTNGNVSGPFHRSSPLDPSGLLSAHTEAFTPSMSARVFSFFGCPIIDPPGWKNTPPCISILSNCVPGIFWDGPNPDGNLWICYQQGIDGGGALACVCERRGFAPIGTPPVNYPVRRACNCGPSGSSCANGFQPGFPPATCPPPSTCPVQYWW